MSTVISVWRGVTKVASANIAAKTNAARMPMIVEEAEEGRHGRLGPVTSPPLIARDSWQFTPPGLA